MHNDNYPSGMKHVGIVSLFGLYNFGNRLQGYALDCALRELGCEPETIVLFRKLGLSVVLARTRGAMIGIKGTPQAKRRLQRFNEFISGQTIRYVWLPSQISKLSGQYDYFCVGSDQVWNPNADLFTHTKLLEFATPEQRIAISPSFGVDRLPSAAEDEYRLALSNYKALSVREDRGAGIVEQLIGYRPPVHIDPTLALSAEQWRRKADCALVPSEPYILAVFLGGWSRRIADYVNLDQDIRRLRVIDLLDVGSSYYGCGPQDYLALIDNATVVLTDSFHASVFSTIFGKPFRVYRRNEGLSTYSRIETLISLYRLGDIEGYGSIPVIDDDRRFLTIEILEQKKVEFLGFLRNALDG